MTLNITRKDFGDFFCSKWIFSSTNKNNVIIKTKMEETWFSEIWITFDKRDVLVDNSIGYEFELDGELVEMMYRNLRTPNR